VEVVTVRPLDRRVGLDSAPVSVAWPVTRLSLRTANPVAVEGIAADDGRIDASRSSNYPAGHYPAWIPYVGRVHNCTETDVATASTRPSGLKDADSGVPIVWLIH
jgi:hypothetical protein